MTKRKTTTSINPATGEVIGKTPEQTVGELEHAVVRAKIAQSEWSAWSFGRRAEHLLKIRDYIVDNADRVSEIISKDTGKTKMDALSMEVLTVPMALTYYASHAKKILKRKKLHGGSMLTVNKRSFVDRVPLGVVGIISPWNYPFSIPFHEIAMALMAGNGVLLKVSSHTLEVGKIIAECVAAGELPSGLFSIVNVPGSIAGDAFLESGIHKLFFTGSVAVGKELMAKAAERLVPVSLELGGNDAMIVCADANLRRAASGALWAGMSNAGQSCAAVERIFVEETVYDDFVSLLKDKMERLKQGVDTDSSVDIGSMTTKEQYLKVLALIDDAVRKGASAFPGVPKKWKGKGLFIPPTILENVNDDMKVMSGEIFGPVLAVKKVGNVEEAVARANASKLGLTASVWTRSRKKGRAIAAKLEVGSVMINDHLMSHGLAETPWGGWKESGIGRTHGSFGLEEMTQPRCVVEDVLLFVQKDMWWHPHSKEVYDGLSGALDFLYAKTIGKKLAGGKRMGKVFLRTFKK